MELTPRQVRLVVCSVEARSFYSFSCSTCGDEVRKHAGTDVVALLSSGGVVPERWVIPAEVLEPHDGPVLSHDDLLDFCLWLESADLLAAVAQASQGRPSGESATL
ncbi:hypothetical protein [Aquipuribacter nitratireducens]|uniref:Uncharacterized protein n=1 Tax=Aquipuribacter nitratireducens TaxID=650104 RepID=A0ABW0GL20_9MICO